jgi:EAL domain-containing protein (putative c-di-GMP-specific phosphodiesterase class I)
MMMTLSLVLNRKGRAFYRIVQMQDIVCIAQGMGKSTVAEFVAAEASVCLLRNSGVQYAPGCHIGLPQAIADGWPAIEDSVVTDR